MASNADREELITFGQAARKVRLKGQRSIAPCTILRWPSNRFSGVRLETICLSGARYTSTEALKLCFDAVTLTRSFSSELQEHRPTSGTMNKSTLQQLRTAKLI